MAGYAITGVAMPVLMLRLSGSALLTAMIAALEVLPYLVFGLVAGALADRYDRRRIMVVCYGVSALAMLSVPLAQLLGVLGPGQLLVVAVLTATCFVWFDAAAFGALPAIAGRGRIVAANSLLVTSATLIDISFPAIAGVLIATVGPGVAIGVDGGSYLLAALLLRRIPRVVLAHSAPTSLAGSALMRTIHRDIQAGLRFLWRHDLVRSLSLLGFGNSLTGGAVSALTVVYGVRQLGLDGSGWQVGLLFSATAAGGLLASVLLPRLVRRAPVGWITIAALSLSPLLVLGLALAPGLTVALLLYAGWATTWVLVSLNGISARQQVTPDDLQGRVNTTARMIAWGGAPFGALLGGLVANQTSMRETLLVIAVIAAVVAVLAWASPLRRRSLAHPTI